MIYEEMTEEQKAAKKLEIEQKDIYSITDDDLYIYRRLCGDSHEVALDFAINRWFDQEYSQEE